MSQVSRRPLSQQVADRMFEIFLKAFIEIKQLDEAEQFLSDLLTPTEKVMLAKRLTIAFLLEKGYDYRTIQQIIRVSTPTISAVNSARQFGNKGYSRLLAKITREERLISLLEESITKLLSAPATLERGSGSWSYMKKEVEKQKKKKKPF